MRLFHASALALCILTIAPVGSVAADPKSDVTSAYAVWDAAFNKGDAKAVAAAYLPNAKLLPPSHEVASGPAAIEKFFAGLHSNGVTNHKLEVIDAGGDGKIIYGTANWSAKGKDKDGKPADFSGIATHVFERQSDNSLKNLDWTPSIEARHCLRRETHSKRPQLRPVTPRRSWDQLVVRASAEGHKAKWP